MSEKARRAISVVSLLALSILPAAAPAQDRYAALAFSPATGRYADAVDQATRADAELLAKGRCGQVASGCFAPVWVQNGCVALATGSRAQFGTGWGSSAALAEGEALTVCHRHGARCGIRHTACVTLRPAASE